MYSLYISLTTRQNEAPFVGRQTTKLVFLLNDTILAKIAEPEDEPIERS